MTVTVLEVGPHSVRGPTCGRPHVRDICANAVAALDEPIVLVDERPVDVDVLWGEVLRVAVGDREGPVALVVPTWWPARRVAVLQAVPAPGGDDVVVLRRGDLFGDTDATVCELSAEYAVITPPGSDPLVLARDAPEVTTHLMSATAVLIDLPADVAPLSDTVLDSLRSCRISVHHWTVHQLHRAVLSRVETAVERPAPHRRIRVTRRAAAFLCGAAITAASAGGGWAAQGGRSPVPSESAYELVEGRVGVQVPAGWTVDRITDGSGSPRIRVAAQGGLPALHVTQSVGSGAVTRATTAEMLRAAIATEPAGVFLDLDPAGELGGRAAVTYVERRSDAETRWTVLAVDAVRIAIGCQHPARRWEAVESVCVQAVRSARVMP